jgi:hypothetical protein
VIERRQRRDTHLNTPRIVTVFMLRYALANDTSGQQ